MQFLSENMAFGFIFSHNGSKWMGDESDMMARELSPKICLVYFSIKEWDWEEEVGGKLS